MDDKDVVQSQVGGTFQSSPGLLSAFNGLSLDGHWQPKLQDDTGFTGDGNALISWSIQGNSVPLPATVLLLGAGLAHAQRMPGNCWTNALSP